LLENGANTSFVNRISDAQAPIENLIEDPVAVLRGVEQLPHPRIVLPRDLYGEERSNSLGINLYDVEELNPLAQGMAAALQATHHAAPLIGGKVLAGETREIVNPANTDEVIGTVADATDVDVEQALSLAHEASHQWQRTAVSQRADILVRAAELMEQRKSELMALVIKEGGRTIADALSEVREAIDSCRYYALRARQEMEAPTLLPGPTGERNELQLCGRGVFVCISPWNFPVAIYTGQIAAALAAGNTVIAKPSSQTPLSAMCVVRILLEAGVPEDVLHLLPGSGGAIGQALVEDPRVAGVVFTGSTDTARRINLALAKRPGPIVPFIAETGGQNAMIVDSSALPEQVVVDAITSAFNSAGQRCSALRVLFVQEEIADRTFDLLYGAMDELSIGDPALLTTDVGPVIDAAAKKALEQHVNEMKQVARQHHQVSLDLNASTGHFVAPFACEIDSLDQLAQENFGPILHLIRYQSKHLDDVIKSINATGYGLTLGIHTRIESTASYIRERVNVGNIYVNRNMIGAVVGTQPFGGEGLSGTGPKAGGPYYLHRFATEHTYTVNTAAIGGNASLLTIDED
jgi:RHH-type proline utilization regulon transcriptional repressor/proline dehydrogenase/delta 1-pyrroline-5-carboxylate dehydrogenase